MYVYCLINWLLGPKNINVLQMIIFFKTKTFTFRFAVLG